MPSGTVKWFNTTKGYGFIAPDDGGSDIFVHISAVEQSGMTGLADDQKVTFDLVEGRDGRKMAGNLARAEKQRVTTQHNRPAMACLLAPVLRHPATHQFAHICLWHDWCDRLLKGLAIIFAIQIIAFLVPQIDKCRTGTLQTVDPQKQ